MLRVLAIGALFGAAGAAHAQTFEAINNCRQLVDGADRVACYDALKPEPAAATVVAADAKAREERQCHHIPIALAGGNCQEGDIMKIDDMNADDVADMVQSFCDFNAQILTLPASSISSQLAGKPQFVLLCKYHARPLAPSK
ncbi:hypothetical protein FJ417_24620 [Mesorhizobium sp. B3-1-7]|uniref:hypothetical protein n=1 Tax=Mesorhizobium sp. B3-1-7 TaxID=2589894 RepID=UPI00112DE236|nr:hypothetical protein [Mesorhizobium sp. B3-1-7]TPI54738.1 hypothetical protein FJ417_24620 [Mesorhizobium sp. B3-1-7]